MATIVTFRRLALGLPEATEGAHMGHPDFRVRNKIFASLGVPDADWGMVKLTPEQQEVLIAGAAHLRACGRRLGSPRRDPRAAVRCESGNAAERAHHGLAQHGTEGAGPELAGVTNH